VNNLLLVFSDLEHSFFNRTKKLCEKPSYRSYEMANSQLSILSLESTKGLVGLDIVSLFLCFCFAVPLFSLSLVGMEREFPSAFLLPGSVLLSGISGSFFFFLADEGQN
jgi:hypothetical protein